MISINTKSALKSQLFASIIIVLLILFLSFNKAIAAEYTITQITNNDNDDWIINAWWDDDVHDKQVVLGSYVNGQYKMFNYNGSSFNNIWNSDYPVWYLRCDSHYIAWSEFGDTGQPDKIFLSNGSSIIPITQKATDVGYFRMDQGQVVWVEIDSHDVDVQDREVLLYNGAETFTLRHHENLTLPGHDKPAPDLDDYEPDISNGQVVWIGSRFYPRDPLPNHDWYPNQILFYNGAQAISLQEPYDGSIGYSPHIHNGQIVWAQPTYDYLQHLYLDTEIFYYNGINTVQFTDNTYNDYHPIIKDGKILWFKKDAQNSTELMFYNGSTTIQLTQTANKIYDLYPQMNDGKVAWVSYDDASDLGLYFYNGTSVVKLGSEVDGFHLNHGRVVWSAWDGNDMEIFYYDGINTTQLTNNDYDDENPMMDNNGKIFWQGYDGNDYEVYLATFGKPGIKLKKVEVYYRHEVASNGLPIAGYPTDNTQITIKAIVWAKDGDIEKPYTQQDQDEVINDGKWYATGREGAQAGSYPPDITIPVLSVSDFPKIYKWPDNWPQIDFEWTELKQKSSNPVKKATQQQVTDIYGNDAYSYWQGFFKNPDDDVINFKDNFKKLYSTEMQRLENLPDTDPQKKTMIDKLKQLRELYASNRNYSYKKYGNIYLQSWSANGIKLPVGNYRFSVKAYLNKGTPTEQYEVSTDTECATRITVLDADAPTDYYGKDYVRWLTAYQEVPYEWGGYWFGGKEGMTCGGPRRYEGHGVDCSGLVSIGAKWAGYNWSPWKVTTGSLANRVEGNPNYYSRKIDPTDLMPGDILVKTGDNAHVVTVYKIKSKTDERLPDEIWIIASEGSFRKEDCLDYQNGIAILLRNYKDDFYKFEARRLVRH